MMMDDSLDSQMAEGGIFSAADHPTSSSNNSGHNSSGSSSSSSSYLQYSYPLTPIYESEVDSLPQVAFGNSTESNGEMSGMPQGEADEKVATTTTNKGKSKSKRSPTRSKRRRVNFHRNVLLPKGQGGDDENDMTTKQQPQSNTRYLGAILILSGMFVLEYTRNVGQATHSFESKGNNPRHLKKQKRGSIRAAAGAGGMHSASQGRRSQGRQMLAPLGHVMTVFFAHRRPLLQPSLGVW